MRNVDELGERMLKSPPAVTSSQDPSTDQIHIITQGRPCHLPRYSHPIGSAHPGLAWTGISSSANPTPGPVSRERVFHVFYTLANICLARGRDKVCLISPLLPNPVICSQMSLAIRARILSLHLPTPSKMTTIPPPDPSPLSHPPPHHPSLEGCRICRMQTHQALR